MVKKFTANCDFGGRVVPVTFYVGNPAANSHPLGFQSKWLGKERGGNVPPEIMDSFSKLKQISDKNKVPFEDLCDYVIAELRSSETLQDDVNKSTSMSNPSADKSKGSSGSDKVKKEAKAKAAAPKENIEDSSKQITKEAAIPEVKKKVAAIAPAQKQAQSQEPVAQKPVAQASTASAPNSQVPKTFKEMRAAKTAQTKKAEDQDPNSSNN